MRRRVRRVGGYVVAEYRVALYGRAEVAPGVTSFRFERPGGYEFEPGQYFSLTLETEDGPVSKPFTHSDAPGDGRVELTTRMTGSVYKSTLSGLTPGETVGIRGPLGTRALPEAAARAVFLVGGVGITPARSVLRDSEQRHSGLEAVVFYGNHDAACVPFGEELHGMAARGGVGVVDVLEAPDPGWRGERGFIDAALVRRHIDPYAGWHYVVAGPPAMVEAMDKVIAELGVPAEAVTTTRFSGYR